MVQSLLLTLQPPARLQGAVASEAPWHPRQSMRLCSRRC